MQILVIKHSALGDIILATAAFAAIRQHFPHAHITLLTTKAYASMLAQSPYFDEILVDERPKLFDLKGILKLRAKLNSKRWDWIFDLQNSSRTQRYTLLLKKPWPQISGEGQAISHPRPAYNTGIHALQNLKAQLLVAGIAMGDLPQLEWLTEKNPSPLVLPASYALLVPGGAAHRPQKRWPAKAYAALAQYLVAQGITPVLIGTKAEAQALDEIAHTVPEALNLGAKTTLAQLADLARGATLAIGNDTGPMHIIAASGCPSTVLFSGDSDPVRAAPLGSQVNILREENLADLAVETVLAGLTARA